MIDRSRSAICSCSVTQHLHSGTCKSRMIRQCDYHIICSKFINEVPDDSSSLTGAIRTSIISFFLEIKYAWALHLCSLSKSQLIDSFKEVNQSFNKIMPVRIGIHCHWITPLITPKTCSSSSGSELLPEETSMAITQGSLASSRVLHMA